MGAATYPDGVWLDGLQQLVDRLSARLGRSVCIDDAQGRLVVASGHFGDEDDLRVWAIVHRFSDPRVMEHFRSHGIYSWTRPGRVPENPELQFKARVCCPIRDHDILFGHLFLIDEGVTDPQIEEAAATAEQVGGLMYHRLALDEEGQRRAEILVRELVSPDPWTRRRAAQRAVEGRALHAADPVAALVVALAETDDASGAAGSVGADTDLRSAVHLATRDRLRGLGLVWLRPGEGVVLLFGRGAATAGEVAAAIVGRLEARGHRAVAGVGPVRSGDGAAATSYADAALTARAVRLLPELGTVAGSEDLGVYRWLLTLPRDELHPSRYPAPLRRLIEADPAGGLLETLATYLECGGDVGRASSALHVHRSTLYYRLGRIEELAGVDLRDGSQRLELHVGLKLRRLIQQL